jgi:hypothetical protein
MQIVLEPGEHTGLLEPRWQDARVVTEIAIGVRTGRDDPRMVRDLSATDHDNTAEQD